MNPQAPNQEAIAQEEGPQPYPGFWQAVGLLLIFLLTTICLLIPFAFIDNAARTKLLTAPVVSGLATLAGAYVAARVARKHEDVPWSAFTGPMRIPQNLIRPATMLIIGVLIANALQFLWLTRAFPSWAFKDDFGLKTSLIGPAFTLMLVAPLTEELLFRGILLPGFAARYGWTRGILLSALLFSLLHVHPFRLLGTFLIGVIFAWWRRHTGNIWLGIFGHVLNNGVPVLIAIGSRLSPREQKDLPPFSPAEIPIGILGLVLAYLGWRAIRREFAAAHEPIPL